MALGYRTATGTLVGLKPIHVEIGVDGADPHVELRGTRSAELMGGRAIRAAQQAFEFPTAEAARTLSAERGPATLKKTLKAKQFSAFQDEESGLLRVLYREIVIRFARGVPVARQKAIIAKSKLAVRAPHENVPGQWILYDENRRLGGVGLVETARDLAELDEVAFATPNFMSEYKRLGKPSIPAVQWHLRLVRAAEAWKMATGKRSVTIAIVDDGVDVEHPELAPNIHRNADPNEPRDVCGRDFFVDATKADHFNPRPKIFQDPFDDTELNDIHGTCCAGVAASRGKGALGLAPNCRILPVKIFHGSALASDARTADALRYAATFADVVSCSWAGSRSPDLEFALRDGATDGRGGRGAVFVCATGNEEAKRVGFPASDPHCIAVGASTDKDRLSWYSNQGRQVCIVAPSNGGMKNKEIFTTDVSVPGRGYNGGAPQRGDPAGLYAIDFGGTSSATPLVAGLCGLLLSKKPSLTAEEVRTALIAGAVKVGPKSSYDKNGHSKAFGFGRIDALASLKAIS